MSKLYSHTEKERIIKELAEPMDMKVFEDTIKKYQKLYWCMAKIEVLTREYTSDY